jgi:hypothetical protein
VIVHSAPRYHERIVEAIRALDDRRVPIAETCRRVGRRADELGLPRPSYVHLRRLIHAERERRDAVRELIDDIVDDIAHHRLVHPYDLTGRIRDLPPGA